jgi:hypothetical protein
MAAFILATATLLALNRETSQGSVKSNESLIVCLQKSLCHLVGFALNRQSWSSSCALHATQVVPLRIIHTVQIRSLCVSSPSPHHILVVASFSNNHWSISCYSPLAFFRTELLIGRLYGHYGSAEECQKYREVQGLLLLPLSPRSSCNPTGQKRNEDRRSWPARASNVGQLPCHCLGFWPSPKL